jgi:hypothetical protein
MLKRNVWTYFLFAALALLWSATEIQAQDARGQIVGRLSDTTGAAIPNVQIKATNVATGITLTGTTNEEGMYEIPYLTIGIYSLRVQATGFKSYARDNLEVRVGDRLGVDITLEPGSVTETVTVTAESPLLETTNANLGDVVDERRITELPLSGGSPVTLMRFTTGLNDYSVPNHPSLAAGQDAVSNVGINGTRSGNVEFSVNGVPNMASTFNAYSPPADMVQEFKVQTATYDAANGHVAGGNVNMALKSGTNKFHGSLYEFHTNNTLQAMDIFQRQFLYDPASGPVTREKERTVSPQTVLNRYGFTFSGPVFVPKVYDGRNRTFWIFGFEGFNRPGIERGNYFYTVPTAAQRNGDFSALLGANQCTNTAGAIGTCGGAFTTPLMVTNTAGAMVQARVGMIYDPATIRAETGGRFSRRAFAGNIIPTGRIDAVAKNLLSYYPQPNTPGTADGRNNFFSPTRSLNEFHSETLRVDHSFGDKQRVFGHYYQTGNLFASGQFFGNETTGNDRLTYARGFAFDHVYVFSPRVMNNFRYGVTRFTREFVPVGKDFDLTKAGFSAGLAGLIDPLALTFPQIAVDQLPDIGTTFPSQRLYNYHTMANDLTWTRGAHSLKFGGDFRLYRDSSYSFNFGTPRIEFGTLWTRGPLDNVAAAPIGQGLASFLLGIPTGGRLDRTDSFASQSVSYAGYVNDNWRATQRLTLTLGLRYEYDAPPTERFNRTVRGFDAQAASPIEAQARALYAQSPIPQIPVDQFRVRGGLTFAGVNGQPRGLWNPDRNNLMPRVGLAYQWRKDTVIRAGYGIFYVPSTIDRLTVNQSGFVLRNDIVPSNNNGLQFIASLANPFPNGVLSPPGASAGLLTDVGRALTFFNEDFQSGYQQRWSLGVQQQLGDVLIAVSYVGNRGTKLAATRNINPVPAQYLSTSPVRDQAVITLLAAQVNNPLANFAPGTTVGTRTVTRAQLLRPYPQFLDINVDEPNGYSWYHALQSRLERRFSKGFTVTGTWTWSKFMEATSYLNPADPLLHEVVSDLDRTHRVTATGIYELPFGRGRHWFGNARGVVDGLIGGWQLQGVWQANTGAPLGFGNAILLGDIRDVALSRNERTYDRWFRTELFDRDAARQLANNIRTLPLRFNGIRGPELNVWNLSAMKKFRITESVALQFRSEFLNAFNRSGLSAPNTVTTNTLFGRVTATNGFPRQIHFALKLTF